VAGGCAALVLVMSASACAGSRAAVPSAARYRSEIARVCARSDRRVNSEHLNIATPDTAEPLLALTTRTEQFLRDQLDAVNAFHRPHDAQTAEAWLAEEKQLIDAFGAERRILIESLPSQQRRIAELARIDSMPYAEVRSLGRRFRPLQQLALAMRARHKTVVNELPIKMRKLREYQAHFYMLNAPDSPVHLAGLYAFRHIFPLARGIEKLSPSIGGARCLPSVPTK
jgi:hypothetical protein